MLSAHWNVDNHKQTLHFRCLHERVIVDFKALGDRTNPPGGSRRLTFKVLLIEQITGEIG